MGISVITFAFNRILTLRILGALPAILAQTVKLLGGPAVY